MGRLPSRQLARVAFWAVFLAAAGWQARRSWVEGRAWEKNPLIVSARTRFHLRRLRDPDPRRAERSWIELHRLYLSSWQAFHLVSEHFLDEEPVRFALTRQSGRFWPDESPAAGPGCCATVGEALLAIAHDENPFWPAPFQGDWKRWLIANRGYYPLSARDLPQDAERASDRHGPPAR